MISLNKLTSVSSVAWKATVNAAQASKSYAQKLKASGSPMLDVLGHIKEGMYKIQSKGIPLPFVRVVKVTPFSALGPNPKQLSLEGCSFMGCTNDGSLSEAEEFKLAKIILMVHQLSSQQGFESGAIVMGGLFYQGDNEMQRAFIFPSRGAERCHVVPYGFTYKSPYM